MKDKTRRKPPRGTLPEFLPVPRHYNRHDGWTAERQRAFIAALADCGSVRRAAHAVNMTPESAYQLRRHAKAASFRQAWEAALALGVQRLEDVAMDRALNGTEVPVYSYGKLVGTRIVHNDRLVMFLLRNRAGKRFRADARHDAPTRQELDKLKAKWREEWAEERGLNRSEAEVRAAIDRKVAEVRERVLARAGRELAEMSDETRELKRRYEESRARDREARNAPPGLPAPEAP